MKGSQWWLQERQFLQIEASGVDCHPDGCMNSHRVEGLNIVDGCDPAGRGNLVVRGRAQAAEPVEVCALHHAFLIDVSAEEARAVRLDLANDIFRGEVSRFLPALADD